jgi:hypothetical protein
MTVWLSVSTQRAPARLIAKPQNKRDFTKTMYPGGVNGGDVAQVERIRACDNVAFGSVSVREMLARQNT